MKKHSKVPKKATIVTVFYVPIINAFLVILILIIRELLSLKMTLQP